LDVKTLQKILPKTSGQGGTRVGSSFLDAWACKFEWYAQHLAPFPGGHGSEPTYSAEPLWLGGIIHKGLEDYFRSGWQDGSYQIEAALAGATGEADKRLSELPFADEDTYAKLLAQAHQVLERYAKWAGPSGSESDWDLWRPFDANGEPLIEVEFEVDLEWEGYFYTTKPDIVVWRLSDGALCALDHKTMSASNATLTLETMRKRPQLTGEQLALMLTWPEEKAGVMVNGIIKNAAAAKPPRRLENVDRVEARLDLFRTHTIRKLQEIERHVEEYWDLLQKGVPEPLAARMVFDDEPTDQLCQRYNRKCPFLDTCIRADSVVEWHSAERKARYLTEGESQ